MTINTGAACWDTKSADSRGIEDAENQEAEDVEEVGNGRDVSIPYSALKPAKYHKLPKCFFANF